MKKRAKKERESWQDTYYKLGFHKAVQEMKKYLDFLEDRYVKGNKRK